MSLVCVDAGLVVKFVSPEPDSAETHALFLQWRKERVGIIAPAFAAAEIDSVLRSKTVRGILTSEVADAAFHLALRLPIKFELATDCRERAWEMASIFGLATVYDAVYLALAERRNCGFWTADEKLFDSVKSNLHWVHRLGNLHK